LSLPWRSVWRSKGVDEEPLEPVHHMEAYREVLKYFVQLSMNCQAAIECEDDECDLASSTLGADFINERQLAALENNKITHGSVMGMGIQLIDIPTVAIIDKMKLNIDAIGFHYGRNILVSVSQITENEHLLSVWRVDNSLNLTRIKDVSIWDLNRYSCKDSVQVDEHYRCSSLLSSSLLSLCMFQTNIQS